MNIQQMMKQAQQMQKKMERAQQELAEKEFSGTSGGGMVDIIVKGTGQVTSVKIKPEAVDVDDLEMLEDLIVAAFNDAKSKQDDESSSTMQSAAGGMLPDGFKLPF